MACPCENNTSSTPNIPCAGQNTCVEIVSSDCILYVGTEKKCGTDVVYENGDSLSTVQSKIVDYICEKVTPAPTCFTHYVGEVYGGGVVFHVYKDALGEEHGLIVSLVDLGFAQYSNIVNAASGATSTWNGQGNTTILQTQSGATSGAWKDCLDYTYSGFSDWYLPAIDELVLLWNNRYNVNKSLDSLIITHDLIDQTENYWSSTESAGVPNNNAFYLFALEGTPLIRSKGDTIQVRPIRQF